MYQILHVASSETYYLKRANFNPIKAGGSESMYSLDKGLENRYRVEMHVHSQIFQGQLID